MWVHQRKRYDHAVRFVVTGARQHDHRGRYERKQRFFQWQIPGHGHI